MRSQYAWEVTSEFSRRARRPKRPLLSRSRLLLTDLRKAIHTSVRNAIATPLAPARSSLASFTCPFPIIRLCRLPFLPQRRRMHGLVISKSASLRNMPTGHCRGVPLKPLHMKRLTRTERYRYSPVFLRVQKSLTSCRSSLGFYLRCPLPSWFPANERGYAAGAGA